MKKIVIFTLPSEFRLSGLFHSKKPYIHMEDALVKIPIWNEETDRILMLCLFLHTNHNLHIAKWNCLNQTTLLLNINNITNSYIHINNEKREYLCVAVIQLYDTIHTTIRRGLNIEWTTVCSFFEFLVVSFEERVGVF